MLFKSLVIDNGRKRNKYRFRLLQEKEKTFTGGSLPLREIRCLNDDFIVLQKWAGTSCG